MKQAAHREPALPHPSLHQLAGTWLVLTYTQLGAPTLRLSSAGCGAQSGEAGVREVGGLPSWSGERHSSSVLSATALGGGKSAERGSRKGGHGSSLDPLHTWGLWFCH